MSVRSKITIVLLMLVVIAVGALLLLLPRLANIDQFRPRLVANLAQQTGRSVEIGRLTLAVLPKLSIRADNVTVGNPPGFPTGDFLEIHRVDADLDFASVLQRRLAIKSLELDEPVVNLLVNSSGHWNTESPRAARIQSTAWVENPAAPVAVAAVEIKHGRVTYAPVSDAEQPPLSSFEAENVSAQLHDVNVEALGLKINPSATGAPPAVSPLSPQGPLVARGTFSAQSARFGKIETAGLSSGVELDVGGVHLDSINIKIFGGRLTGDFTWDSGSQPPQYATHLTAASVDAARLLAAFPNAGGKLTGTLEGHLDMNGAVNSASTPPILGDPLADKEGTGDLTVRNGTLPELRVNADMRQLLKNIVRTGSGSSDPSSFRSISADFEIGEGEIRSRQITILGNGIEMDVGGRVALGGAGKLDYQGVGKIDAQRNGYSSVLAGLLGSKISGGRITFPFTLTGTLESPRFGIKSSPWFH